MVCMLYLFFRRTRYSILLWLICSNTITSICSYFAVLTHQLKIMRFVWLSESQRIVPVTVQGVPMAFIKATSGHGILTDIECLWSTRKRVRSECGINKRQTCNIYFWGKDSSFFVSYNFLTFAFSLSSLSYISSSCLTVSRASRQIRPCVQTRSWS